MTIRNMAAFVAGLWDWGWLDQGKVRVSDLDGILERRGRFLVLEAKSPGQKLPTGQRIMLEALAAKPEFEVLVLWGRDSTPEAHQFLGHKLVAPSSPGLVRGVVRDWFRAASEGVPFSPAGA